MFPRETDWAVKMERQRQIVVWIRWTGTTRLTLLSFQLDYTEAGTCDKCYEKRKNVSNAAESCSCTVVFAIDKRFKVSLCDNVFLNWHKLLHRSFKIVLKDELCCIQFTFYCSCIDSLVFLFTHLSCCCSRETSSSTTVSKTSIRTSGDTWTPEMTHKWLAEKQT